MVVLITDVAGFAVECCVRPHSFELQDSDTVSTHLLGQTSSLTSVNLSKKLAHKFKSQFYISCNFSDPLILAQLESWLFEHFKQEEEP